MPARDAYLRTNNSGVHTATKHQSATNEKVKLPTSDFGAFYPTGYIAIAFEKYEDTQHVCEELRAGGWDKQDCNLHTAEKVAEAAQCNIDNSGFMSRLGSSIAAVQKHLEAAKHGATFLLVYAPTDSNAERVTNIVRRRPYILAHRYHRLAIEDLGGSDTDSHAKSPR